MNIKFWKSRSRRGWRKRAPFFRKHLPQIRHQGTWPKAKDLAPDTWWVVFVPRNVAELGKNQCQITSIV